MWGTETHRYDNMNDSLHNKPELVVEYTDPVEGFKGWLVIDCMAHSLCAGGLRVQQGLTLNTVKNLAATMTLKMRIAGIRADGAKSGIDYPPDSPGKEKALFRFIRAIKPYIKQCYSMGPDMNTTMPELDAICSSLDIPSIKIAIANAQGLGVPAFNQRIALLHQQAGPESLGQLRAGVGVAAAAMASLDELATPIAEATVVIQGFGCLAASAAHFLNQAGIQIIGLADAEKSLISRDGAGLDISTLLKGCSKGLIPDDASLGNYGTREEIYKLPCDIFIPAAIEKAIDTKEAQSMEVRAIACGANLAVTASAEEILQERGIIVIPDLVAGCGGSLSMEGLFGPPDMPTVEDVIAHVDSKTRKIVRKILQRSKIDGISPREAALRICRETPLFPGTRPYGDL